MPYQNDAFRRRAPRFEAPETFYVLFGQERIKAIEVSESGMRLSTATASFEATQTYSFHLVVADDSGVHGWQVKASCVWARGEEAGFRFLSARELSRELFERLHNLKASGKTSLLSGTEF